MMELLKERPKSRLEEAKQPYGLAFEARLISFTAFCMLSSFEGTKFLIYMSGDDGKEVTPVPIPNTEVKLFSADGSWGSPPVRVGRCQA